MRCKTIGVCMLALVSNVAASMAREWNDTMNQHLISAELADCQVTLRLADGRTRPVKLSKLSAEDQKFVLEAMETALHYAEERIRLDNLPSQADRSGPQRVPVDPAIAPWLIKLRAALVDNDDKTIAACIEAVRKIDPTLQPLRSLALAINSENDQPAFYTSYSIRLLKEVCGEAPWAVDFLLSKCRDAPAWRGGSTSVRKLHVHRQLTEMLAGLVGKDDRVKQFFATRIAELKAGTEPAWRARAAITLSGARPLSGQIVPLLKEAVRKDPSAEVQEAALIALGGFGDEAKPFIPMIMKRFKESKDSDSEFVYLVTVADIDPKAAPLRKEISANIQNYNILSILEVLGPSAAWATPALIESAKKTDDDNFKRISRTLIAVAPNDKRVLNFFETSAQQGSPDIRVYSDSVLKHLKKQTENQPAPAAGE
jgi:hypothetical protein